MNRIVSLIITGALSAVLLSAVPVSAQNVKVDKAKIAKLQSEKPGKITVKIKKIKKCTGYNIKISQKRNFEKSKIYKTKNNKKTISSLAQGKKYYVKVRGYRKININGKPKLVYGKWSKVKTVETKENLQDKQYRNEIKNHVGISLSDDVRFLEYSKTDYTVNIDEAEYTPSYFIYAKIKIKETEIKKIIKNHHFNKSNNAEEAINIGYEVDWWSFDESDFKGLYNHAHSLKVTDQMVIKTIWESIVIVGDKDKNGRVTAYLCLI